MEEAEIYEDDILEVVNFDDLGQIDWDSSGINLFDGLPLPDSSSLPTPLATESSFSPENFSNSSSDSVSLWIGQVENILMSDDCLVAAEPSSQQYSDDFLADILVVDSPADASAPDFDASTDKDTSVSSEKEKEKEKEKVGEKIVDDEAKLENDSEDPDDPISKKRRRQLRNRDAAVRSRERKKMYVRDLQIKSRYLEGECRRLGRLLQCFIAENQALRLGLQKGGAFGVTSAEQESAVLLLESLLLGSLLWFLGIMCLFPLPKIPQATLVAVPLGNMEKTVLESGVGSKMFTDSLIQFSVDGRRCKASRTRMKTGFICIEVLI